MNKEKLRLIEDRDKKKNWRKFGPYVTERQWGTVREDYSAHGNAWEFVSHDAARSKAYRWGEEGIGVLIAPGPMLFTRIFIGAYSCAMLFISIITPPFEAA